MNMVRVQSNLLSRVLSPSRISCAMMSGADGSGAGKGGGAGGAVRSSGGSMGKREVAQEEQYFRKQQAEQLAKLKEHLSGEVKAHENLIKQHEETIRKTKEKIEEIKKLDK